MRKFFCLAAVAIVVASMPAADVLTWTGGGDGLRWSDSRNWSSSGDHPVPVTGDSVEIDIGSTPTTMENDLSGVSLAKFTAVGQNDIVLTITGNPIGLVGQTDMDIHVWTNSCSLQLDAGTSLTGGSGAMYFGGYSTLVNGDLFAGSGCTLKIRGRPWSASSTIQPDLINNEPSLKFYGDIGGDGSTLYLAPGVKYSGTTANYYGNIICANLYLAPDTCQHIAYFNKSGNRIGAIRYNGYRAHFNVSDAFTADTVINLDEDCGDVDSTYAALRFSADSYHVLNRLEGGNPADNPARFSYQRIFAGNKGTYASPKTDSCTLELKGTANAVSYVCLCDAVNVIWNPTGNYTQDFRDIRHVTSGHITVKGGTVRTSGTNSFVNLQYLTVASGATLEVASTNVTAFPAVQSAFFGAGAKLRVTEAESVPFTAEKTLLSLGTGAKIEMATGATVNIGRLYVNGNEIAAGTYTTEDWMEGAGTVNVAGTLSGSGSSLFRWMNPAGGAWNTPTCWLTGSVPHAYDTAYLDSLGNGYTVTFDGATDIMPRYLNLTGNGVTMSFANESDFHTRNINLKDGAKMLIPSGAVFTRTNTMVVTVYKDSEVCVTGTGLLQVTGSNTSGEPVSLRGGRFLISDNAVLDTAPQKIGTSMRYYFNEGETIFSDSSQLTIRKQDSLYVKPSVDGGNALLVFKDSAGIANPASTYLDPLAIGDGKSEGRVEFLSDFTHARAYTCRIGSPAGKGTMLVGAGTVYINPRGIWVGGAAANQWSKPATSGGVGHLVVTGGVLRIGGTSVSEGSFPGLTLGEAAWIADSIVNNYKPWTGYFTQSGGIVTNASNTCVGGQRGTGTFLQTGGEFYGTSANHIFCAGIRGGRGDVDFNGGKAEIKGDVYAGGIFTNAIPHSTSSTAKLLPEYGWSNLVHYGTGKIKVAGGNVQFKRDLFMGFDGTGIVERVGSSGAFTIDGNITMSNTVEFASASVMRFVLDENGIDPIRVGGTVTTVPGSRIEVDISAYAGRKSKHTLLAAGSIIGSFDDIEITGGSGMRATPDVLVDSTSITLVIPTGMQILIR